MPHPPKATTPKGARVPTPTREATEYPMPVESDRSRFTWTQEDWDQILKAKPGRKPAKPE